MQTMSLNHVLETHFSWGSVYSSEQVKWAMLWSMHYDGATVSWEVIVKKMQEVKTQELWQTAVQGVAQSLWTVTNDFSFTEGNSHWSLAHTQLYLQFPGTLKTFGLRIPGVMSQKFKSPSHVKLELPMSVSMRENSYQNRIQHKQLIC